MPDVNNKKIGRIGVLMGGPSSERKISLKSGKAVYDALKKKGLDVVPLDICDKRVKETLKKAKIALAFIALHGKFGEDGTIQQILESLNIPYTGSGVRASRLCIDKAASRGVLKQNNIRVPEYAVLRRRCWKKQLQELELRFPLVVKPSKQGSSIGVSFVDSDAKLYPAISCAFDYDDTIIVDEYIQGREITVGILADKPLPVVEILPKRDFFDFQAKYQKGKTRYVVPAELPKRSYAFSQQIGLLAHRALGCRNFSRVDMILKAGLPSVLEVNSIPGLTTNSLLPMACACQGVSFTELCLKLIYLALNNPNSI